MKLLEVNIWSCRYIGKDFMKRVLVGEEVIVRFDKNGCMIFKKIFYIVLYIIFSKVIFYRIRKYGFLY